MDNPLATPTVGKSTQSGLPNMGSENSDYERDENDVGEMSSPFPPFPFPHRLPKSRPQVGRSLTGQRFVKLGRPAKPQYPEVDLPLW